MCLYSAIVECTSFTQICENDLKHLVNKHTFNDCLGWDYSYKSTVEQWNYNDNT